MSSTISCRDNEDPIIPEKQTEQTIIMFFPWSTNLLSYFQQNIRDFSEAIEKKGLNSERVIVCLSSSPSTAELFELKYKDGKCIADTLKYYQDQSFVNHFDITKMLNDIKNVSSASRYGLIIGCHGMGWLPIKGVNTKSTNNLLHYDIQTTPMTRYFGGLSPKYQIEVKDLAEGILNAGLKMEYILFDDCYMSSIEVAYDLKDVTDFLIACPTEVLVYGFPYHKCGEFLIGKVNYASIINAFYDFYNNYQYPYGTAAVTDCRELDKLATIIQQINSNKTIKDKDIINNIQKMDGYSPTIFFDFGDYISQICSDSILINEFVIQLNKTIPFKCCTEKYYSALKGALPIYKFSGITTSEPSTNQLATSVQTTEWYKVTH